MPKGGKREGAGRPSGCKNRYRQELDRILKERGELTPLEVLQAVQKDPDVAVETVIRAAQAAAPYVHRRKPQAMEITGKFEFLSPEERELRRSLLLEEIRSDMAKRSAVGNSN